ncbi:hypothetical protein N8K70_03880 [Microbacterium betulae]|uniref:Uncharacterized protein n=1 Tax=Microbacterium betulae TaxID=2981139 RepID=A0AA97FIT8_9MICO|nr:hypothetical protein [Microbacterium sp. AB]WOF23830.1 hypothetical protein N8K70_03880 [Microbacterium sp. AB]
MFDPVIAQLILDAVVLGMEPDRAALAYGITADEHAEWKAAPPTDEVSTELMTAAHAEYAQNLAIAIARAEYVALRAVREKSSDADRWFLERRFPEKWAKIPAAVRAAQAPTPRAGSGDVPEGVVPEDRMERLRREREDQRRAGGNA